MIPEPPMYIIKSFSIFHLNMNSELQTLCGCQHEIITFKLSFRVILEEDRDILLKESRRHLKYMIKTSPTIKKNDIFSKIQLVR